jgi:hypothetical protein
VPVWTGLNRCAELLWFGLLSRLLLLAGCPSLACLPLAAFLSLSYSTCAVPCRASIPADAEAYLTADDFVALTCACAAVGLLYWT